MTQTGAAGSDMQTGLAMLFGVLGILAAIAMLVYGFNGNQSHLAGWGFGGSVIAGSLLVAALHIYE